MLGVSFGTVGFDLCAICVMSMVGRQHLTTVHPQAIRHQHQGQGVAGERPLDFPSVVRLSGDEHSAAARCTFAFSVKMAWYNPFGIPTSWYL